MSTCLHEDCCFSEIETSEIEYSKVSTNVSTTWPENCCLEWLLFQWDRVQQRVYLRTVVSEWGRQRVYMRTVVSTCLLLFQWNRVRNVSTWGLLFQWDRVRVYLRTVVWSTAMWTVVSVSWSTTWTCLPENCCFSEIKYSNISTWGLLFQWDRVQQRVYHEDCCFSEIEYSNMSTWGLLFQWDRVRQRVYMRIVVSVRTVVSVR